MSTLRGVGGRAVPGANPVDVMRFGQSGPRKRTHRGGRNRKKPQAPSTSELTPAHSAESTSGAEAGSESSVHGYYAAIEKVTDDSSIEDGEDTVVLKDLVDVATKVAGVVVEDIDFSEQEVTGRNRVPDDMPVSTAQLLDQPIEQGDETMEKTPVELWLESKTTHPYKSFTNELNAKIVEHVTHLVSCEYDPTWMREVREMIWRAVIRSNYWWVNPEEGKWTGRQKPVEVNEGVWSGVFDAWVECCARRQDRVGRDIATHEYVRKVEDDVREFIFRAERSGMHSQLEHLAFLLMFDETKRQKHVMDLLEMQERIAIAFTDAGGKMNWKGLGYMRAAGRKPALTYGAHPGIGETVWRAALAEL